MEHDIWHSSSRLYCEPQILQRGDAVIFIEHSMHLRNRPFLKRKIMNINYRQPTARSLRAQDGNHNRKTGRRCSIFGVKWPPACALCPCALTFLTKLTSFFKPNKNKAEANEIHQVYSTILSIAKGQLTVNGKYGMATLTGRLTHFPIIRVSISTQKLVTQFSPFLFPLPPNHPRNR